MNLSPFLDLRYFEKLNPGILGPVSGKILSLETDLGSQITLITIVFSMLKVTRELNISERLARAVKWQFHFFNCHFYCETIHRHIFSDGQIDI